jgi:hypothetical protein
MHPDSKRGIRRKHKARMKRKAVEAFTVFGRYTWGDPKRLEKLADHMAHCSCAMCCNPRHGFQSELTMQEKRAEEAFLAAR